MKLVKVTEITLTIRKNGRIHEKETREPQSPISPYLQMQGSRNVEWWHAVCRGHSRDTRGPGPGIVKESPDICDYLFIIIIMDLFNQWV